MGHGGMARPSRCAQTSFFGLDSLPCSRSKRRSSNIDTVRTQNISSRALADHLRTTRDDDHVIYTYHRIARTFHGEQKPSTRRGPRSSWIYSVLASGTNDDPSIALRSPAYE